MKKTVKEHVQTVAFVIQSLVKYILLNTYVSASLVKWDRGETAPYLSVFVLSIPDVGTGTHAVVGKVSLRLVDPLPTQIFPKVNVKLPHTAGLSFSARECWERGSLIILLCAQWCLLALHFYTSFLDIEILDGGMVNY